MSDPFLGEIRIVGFPFAPRGYAQCQGQRVPIAQNAALFSLLGTCYGGDGQTDFALPDLRGRMPLGIGLAPGRSNLKLGAVTSSEGRPGEGRPGEGGPAEPRQGLALNFVIALEGTVPSRG